MNVAMREWLSNVYWSLPFSEKSKERFRFCYKRFTLTAGKLFFSPRVFFSAGRLKADYISQILLIPELKKSPEYVPLENAAAFERVKGDPKLIAYYLPQFHPTLENDMWWGKGVTEWNNVTRAVPQYVGHAQPRMAGELGYYDLRVEDIVLRQIELAKQYGLFGFAYYYYWFDGKCLLEMPLERLLKNKKLDFPFMLCWANESWSKRFWGNDNGILIEQSSTEESYKAFITSVLKFFRDSRYIRIDGKPVLSIYKPSLIPNCAHILDYWRKFCIENGIGDIYIIGVKEKSALSLDLLSAGFDAQTEFQPATVYPYLSHITHKMPLVRPDFAGIVVDYREIVEKRKYFTKSYKNLFRAISPMWDNTPRRNNKGVIYHGSSPALYKQWLRDIIQDTKQTHGEDNRCIFINAWNEWGEGAYLEPDAQNGYAYLAATRSAIIETRHSL